MNSASVDQILRCIIGEQNEFVQLIAIVLACDAEENARVGEDKEQVTESQRKVVLKDFLSIEIQFLKTHPTT